MNICCASRPEMGGARVLPTECTGPTSVQLDVGRGRLGDRSKVFDVLIRAFPEAVPFQ